MSQQDERYQEVVKRFSKEILAEFHASDPLFNNVIYAIISGVSPYKCLEDLLRAYRSLQKDYTNIVMNGPAPKYMIVTQEVFDNLKETGKL